MTIFWLPEGSSHASRQAEVMGFVFGIDAWEDLGLQLPFPRTKQSTQKGMTSTK